MASRTARPGGARMRSRAFKRVLTLDPDQRARVSEPGVDGPARRPAARNVARPRSRAERSRSARAAGARRRSRAGRRRTRRWGSSSSAPGVGAMPSTAGSVPWRSTRREFDALYNLLVLLVEAGRHHEARTTAQQFVATAPPAQYRADIEQLQGTCAVGKKKANRLPQPRHREPKRRRLDGACRSGSWRLRRDRGARPGRLVVASFAGGIRARCQSRSQHPARHDRHAARRRGRRVRWPGADAQSRRGWPRRAHGSTSRTRMRS